MQSKNCWNMSFAKNIRDTLCHSFIVLIMVVQAALSLVFGMPVTGTFSFGPVNVPGFRFGPQVISMVVQ